MKEIKHYLIAEEVHNARFAEPCRPAPLVLSPAEEIVRVKNKGVLNPLKCEAEIYLGFFFDGTNNNKFRDIKSNSQSNVARLFDVFVGSPTVIKAMYGGKEDGKFNPLGLPDKEFKFYRKVYVPGLGTGFDEVLDPGENLTKTMGLAMAALGESRILWALIQFANQLHAVFTDEPLCGPIETATLIAGMLLPNTPLQIMSYRNTALLGLKARLWVALRPYLKNKPTITRIRLSVFGFSRGSAEARTFVNWLLAGYGDSIAGIPIQIDMLGIFDTVAAVGLSHYGHVTDGHMAWADGENMTIPPEVKRCVHLVSAHEVRMSFSLDSVCVNDILPPNCKEIVYPGVHSDIGGGYPAWDQGRSPLAADRISQLTLAHMYREALMAAVPLAPVDKFRVQDKLAFAVGGNIKNAFNAYVKQTSMPQVPATGGKGVLGVLFPEETQPPEPLKTIMHRHYAHFLAWRKFRINDIDRVKGLIDPNNPTVSKRQDRYDYWRTNEDLKKEVAHAEYIMKHRPGVGANNFALKAGVSTNSGAIAVLGLALDTYVTAVTETKAEDLKEIWPLWKALDLNAMKDRAYVHAIVDWFDGYVHDSRAWFKLGGEADDEWFGSGNDAKGNDRKKNAKGNPILSQKDSKTADSLLAESKIQQGLAPSIDVLSKTQAEWQAKGMTSHPDYKARQQTLDQKKKAFAASKKREEQLLYWGALNGGEHPMDENWSIAGYLRWRKVYQTGNSSSEAKNELKQFRMRILQDQIRQAKIKEDQEKLAVLQKEQSELIKNYLASVRQTRAVLMKNGDDLRAYDQGSSQVLGMLTKPMGKQNQALIDEIEKLKQELAKN